MPQRKDLYFCYDYNLSHYLRITKQCEFLTIAKHPKTLRTFTLFNQSSMLSAAINEYRQLNTN